MYRFHMKVYGCQMNVYDSDKVRTALVRRGWEDSAESEADLVVVTGCSVRGKAEQKVWSELDQYADACKSIFFDSSNSSPVTTNTRSLRRVFSSVMRMKATTVIVETPEGLS